MKVYLKTVPEEQGEVTHVYVTDSGQSRMSVEFLYATIDADVKDFVIVGSN